MDVKIGTAPDSWGVWFADDPRQPPWTQFLDEAAEAGYQWIELGPYGYLPTELPVLRAELDRRGLRVSATFVFGRLEAAGGWPELEQRLHATGALLAALGAQYIVLIAEPYADANGKLIGPLRLDKDGWACVVKNTHRAADLVREHYDLTLLFHNHAESFIEYEDQLEELLQRTDPARVSLCLDTGWFAYRGTDPVEFVRRHHPRIPYLHLKSIDAAVHRQAQAAGASLHAAVGMGLFTEPALGTINFPKLRDLLREIDFRGWAVVEQDLFPTPFDKPLPIARRTRAYLRELGLG